MENRRKGLYTAKACRFCLSQEEPLTGLFDKKQGSKNSVPLSLKILSSISVEVFPSEKMPPYICRRCIFFMDVVYNFKNVCREGDKSILDFVQTGSALEPVVWPPSLVKLFRYGSKPAPDVNVVKVEGGATVEVSQGASDSEGDIENVYNVQIGDGTEEGTSACVKVVTSIDTENSTKERKKDCESMDCWACDECNCTYPLQQLLELHKMQKHRARNVACELCDNKFFTKYDLNIHMLLHSNEMPFQCVACGKRFRRLILLKRHEKLIHSELPQQKCPHCPASFLSSEECETHQLRHQRRGDRKFACTQCDKRFFERSALNRHIDCVHESKSKTMYSCEYCPEQFTSITKLARHVRSHASDRPYPCKYCDKTFIKSHHYTRHLRYKHGSEAQPQEEFRCEQCTESFGSQDELMYHSAIHATQNLTCPLCQEKFLNVDAVTDHIKSHVNGMEFMCDFCELVFTTKEKLDFHLENVHEEELRNTEEMEQDETSMEMEEEDDDEDIKVKEEDDHMVVEIKKPSEFMLSAMDQDAEEKMNNTNSEESESEGMGSEPAMVPVPQAVAAAPPAQLPPLTRAPSTPPTATATPPRDDASQPASNSLTATILRKAEEVKRKVQDTPPQEKKEKPKTESSSGASDKSLRLLEKELQELQRTKKREESTKTPVKTLETIRGRGRPPIYTSTPKPRSEEKKPSVTKLTPSEKKVPEKRAVKENKKPEESKEAKVNNVSAKENKEERDTKTREDKETKSKEDKEMKVNTTKEESKDKSVVKNGSSGNKSSEEPVRRSSRPSKVKDYAKMVNNVRKEEPLQSDDDSEEDDDDEEYVEDDKPEVRPKGRRETPKPAARVPALKSPPSATPTRKRGRPRKTALYEIPAKVKKADEDSEEKMLTDDDTEPKDKLDQTDIAKEKNTSQESTKLTSPEKAPNVLVAPTGQTLKKVPIKALPPGVKPLPLPHTARTIGTTETCEMQIGKKMVKVQKIVMTKAEVEAMAKKGLVEMKDGTMVLKPGVKIPSDPSAIKSTLVGDSEKKTKESPIKPAPSRCEVEDDI